MPDKQAGGRKYSLLTSAANQGRAAGLVAAMAMAALGSSPAAAAEKRYGLTSFDRVELWVDADVEIVHQSPLSALAIGDQAALDRLLVEARDGRLVIRSQKFSGDDRRTARREPLRLRLSAHGLRSLMVMGSSRVTVDRMSGQYVTLSLQGSGAIRVGQMAADRLQVSMIGNGQLDVAGKAKSAEMTLLGAAQLAGAQLQVDDLKLQVDGAGDHQLHAVKRADVAARGAGRVTISGRPVCTVRSAGSGTVQCGQ